ICVLGAASRRNGDEPRDLPAFKILEMLHQRGAFISYHDPHIATLPPLPRSGMRLDSEPLTEEFLRVQDCVVIVTEQSIYDYEWIRRHSRLIVDTRNATAGLAAGRCRIVKA